MKDNNILRLLLEHELAVAKKRAKESAERAERFEQYGGGDRDRKDEAYWTGRAEALETVFAIFEHEEQ